MIQLFIPLLLAHLVGDFMLQPTAWVIDKNKRKIKSPFLYLHIAIHFLLLLLATQGQYILLAIGISISHFLIDLGKLYWSSAKTEKTFFFLDQLLHLICLLGAVYIYSPFVIPWAILISPAVLLLLTALVTVSYVAAIYLKIILSKWAIYQEKSNNAGKYIGILERLFIFFFVVNNYWEGIGFLLAAKSIFRFGDLKDAREVGMTEYILIGTLLSFGFSILCAKVYMYLTHYI